MSHLIRFGAGGSNSGFTTQGGSQSVRTKYRKGDRSRRMWTAREEQILAAALAELVARGWKSDDGFRVGYIGHCEQRLRAEFPNTDLTGNPHINSKIGAWKKTHKTISQILSRSGVGFTADYKIDCDDEQWQQIIQLDSHAKTIRDKAWPLWEVWTVIFGKDRAIGTTAEDIADGARASQQQTNGVESEDYSNDYYPQMDNILPEDNTPPHQNTPHVNIEESSGQSASTLQNRNTSGKKRKPPSSDKLLMDFLGNLNAETNIRLEMIAARIGYEFDLGKARQEVFEKLGNVVGLSLAQRYDLCDILCEKPQRLDIFMGMPEESKLGYVLRFLNQN